MSFKINRVYTRSGDKGQTSLIDGSRVYKNHPLCSSFGGLDEVSCHLGLAKESLKFSLNSKNTEEQINKLTTVSEVIEFIQQELFDLGSQLATPTGFTYPDMWKVTNLHISRLEDLCDFFNQNLSELDSFILPGGNFVASHLHVARAVMRRIERDLVSFHVADTSLIPNEILQYCNRLSDLFFVLIRYVLEIMQQEVPLWKKATERKLPIKIKTLP